MSGAEEYRVKYVFEVDDKALVESGNKRADAQKKTTEARKEEAKIAADAAEREKAVAAALGERKFADLRKEFDQTRKILEERRKFSLLQKDEASYLQASERYRDAGVRFQAQAKGLGLAGSAQSHIQELAARDADRARYAQVAKEAEKFAPKTGVAGLMGRLSESSAALKGVAVAAAMIVTTEVLNHTTDALKKFQEPGRNAAEAMREVTRDTFEAIPVIGGLAKSVRGLYEQARFGAQLYALEKSSVMRPLEAQGMIRASELRIGQIDDKNRSFGSAFKAGYLRNSAANMESILGRMGNDPMLESNRQERLQVEMEKAENRVVMERMRAERYESAKRKNAAQDADSSDRLEMNRRIADSEKGGRWEKALRGIELAVPGAGVAGLMMGSVADRENDMARTDFQQKHNESLGIEIQAKKEIQGYDESITKLRQRQVELAKRGNELNSEQVAMQGEKFRSQAVQFGLMDPRQRASLRLQQRWVQENGYDKAHPEMLRDLMASDLTRKETERGMIKAFAGNAELKEIQQANRDVTFDQKDQLPPNIEQGQSIEIFKRREAAQTDAKSFGGLSTILQDHLDRQATTLVEIIKIELEKADSKYTAQYFIKRAFGG